MKCEVIINPEAEERVVIYAKENNPIISSIKQLAEEGSPELLGYTEGEIVRLDPKNIYAVTITHNKVYALCQNNSYQLKQRLYVIEESLPKIFIKINQSSLVNMNKIERFDTSISGTLKIRLKNGYTDYVSRRQLKFIKERLGI